MELMIAGTAAYVRNTASEGPGDCLDGASLTPGLGSATGTAVGATGLRRGALGRTGAR
jgi:hypothetical protein